MLDEFLKQKHTVQEYMKQVHDILPAGTEKLWEWVCSTDFFIAPASTQYHGAEQFGLVKHSLAVWYALKEKTQVLIPASGTRDLGTDSYDRDGLVASIFHDAVKCNLYSRVQKWRKDKSGKWEGYDGWEVNTDLIQLPHGCESLRLIEKYYTFEHECWAQAVANHMGTPDDYIQKKQYYQAMETYPEVLALHTADVYATFMMGY